MNLYNSLSQTKEPFVLHDKKKVTMYVCGITPYDTTHLGHAFTYVFFDTLRRHLTYKGYTVNYTQNVTDIDDDILKRATQEKRDWKELGTFWTDKFLTDMQALNVQKPTHYVKATDSINTIITIVERLIQTGFAYEKNGNVYFRIKRFEEYGKLSHYSEQQMLLLSKERGADPDDPNKEHPLDFILWSVRQAQDKQFATKPYWDSPWGKGRPGWHIECTAMGLQYLTDVFQKGKQQRKQHGMIDIHGGGRDLIFPHHESEIAQTESFTGDKPFVQYWMHTAMVMYQGEKMSKSLGNLVMVSDLLKKYSPAAIRLMLLSQHYRNVWEYNEFDMDWCEKFIHRIRRVLAPQFPNTSQIRLPSFVIESLDDDMNTPLIIGELEEFVGALEVEIDHWNYGLIKLEGERQKNFVKLQQFVKKICNLLGIPL